MNRTALRKGITEAYIKLDIASGGSVETARLFSEATYAAKEGERKHRNMGKGISNGYRLSIEDAARYFVVKWFHDNSGATERLTTWQEAASLRLDCLYAYALKWALGPKSPPRPDWLDESDYARDIAGNG